MLSWTFPTFGPGTKKKPKVVSEGGANTWQWVPVITAVRERAGERASEELACVQTEKSNIL